MTATEFSLTFGHFSYRKTVLKFKQRDMEQRVVHGRFVAEVHARATFGLSVVAVLHYWLIARCFCSRVQGDLFGKFH